jgi:CheY-like chemotaxis protein
LRRASGLPGSIHTVSKSHTGGFAETNIGIVMSQGTKKQILFVDDDKDTRDLMTILLGKAGHHPVVASGFTEGLQIARQQVFDFILLDLYLEDGTGIDLCQWIRLIDQQTPIYFYTGVAFPADLKKALEAGAQGYFIKPVDFDLLLQTLEEWRPSLRQAGEGDNLPLLPHHCAQAGPA